MGPDIIPEPPWDAELHLWILVVSPMSAPFLTGAIFRDRRRRWPDGRVIRTSPLRTPFEAVRAGRIVATWNTRYRLGPSLVGTLGQRAAIERLTRLLHSLRDEASAESRSAPSVPAARPPH